MPFGLSQWLTSGGLLANIIGFSIVAYDLWPTYRLYRLRQSNHALHIAPLRKEIEECRRTLSSEPGDQEQLDTASLFYSMNYNQDADLHSLRRAMKLPRIDFIRETRNGNIEQALADSYKEVEQAISVHQRQIDKRIRPSFGVGMVLIVVGFSLQLLGSTFRAG